MKTRTLALVLLLVATSAALGAARIADRDRSPQMAAGQSGLSDKAVERGTGVPVPATAPALGTSLAEWNRRNPMQGF